MTMNEKARAQTITLTVHRDRCDPSKWTVAEWKLFCDFVRAGDLGHAAQLARLGVQLMLDDRHQPTGGVLEHIGWSDPNDMSEICETADEASGASDADGPVEVVPMYRGPTQYAVAYSVGTGDDYEGTDVDVFNTLAEAEKFNAGLKAA